MYKYIILVILCIVSTQSYSCGIWAGYTSIKDTKKWYKRTILKPDFSNEFLVSYLNENFGKEQWTYDHVHKINIEAPYDGRNNKIRININNNELNTGKPWVSLLIIAQPISYMSKNEKNYYLPLTPIKIASFNFPEKNIFSISLDIKNVGKKINKYVSRVYAVIKYTDSRNDKVLLSRPLDIFYRNCEYTAGYTHDEQINFETKP